MKISEHFPSSGWTLLRNYKEFMLKESKNLASKAINIILREREEKFEGREVGIKRENT